MNTSNVITAAPSIEATMMMAICFFFIPPPHLDARFQPRNLIVRTGLAISL
jgi:hypothetical protein